MASNRLTKATAEALKPREREYFVWDVGAGSVQGFGIKVLPSGRQVAVFQYRLKGAGRSGWARRFTIGTLGPGLSFSRAKTMAAELRASKVTGGDPVHDTKERAQAAVERNRLAKERTFKALADAWLQKRSKLRSYIQLKRVTKTHLT